MTTSGALARTAGKRTSSPILIDTSKCAFSYPKDPAIPQQPEGITSTTWFRGSESAATVGATLESAFWC